MARQGMKQIDGRSQMHGMRRDSTCKHDKSNVSVIETKLWHMRKKDKLLKEQLSKVGWLGFVDD